MYEILVRIIDMSANCRNQGPNSDQFHDRIGLHGLVLTMSDSVTKHKFIRSARTSS